MVALQEVMQWVGDLGGHRLFTSEHETWGLCYVEKGLKDTYQLLLYVLALTAHTYCMLYVLALKNST